jgi:hypothetical protein
MAATRPDRDRGLSLHRRRRALRGAHLERGYRHHRRQRRVHGVHRLHGIYRLLLR